jgi:hypothetical protein
MIRLDNDQSHKTTGASSGMDVSHRLRTRPVVPRYSGAWGSRVGLRAVPLRATVSLLRERLAGCRWPCRSAENWSGLDRLYQLPPIDWDLITLPAADNEHAMENRLNAEQIAVVLPIIVEQYPFYAPMIFALYTLGLRYCHVAAMRWNKLSLDGVIAIEESYDVSANVFSAVDQRKKAPPTMALEPRTLDGPHAVGPYQAGRRAER